MASRTEQISVRLAADTLARLDAAARKREMDRSEVVREAIRTWLEGVGGESPPHQYARVEDLVGSVSGGPRDLGRRHREHLRS